MKFGAAASFKVRGLRVGPRGTQASLPPRLGALGLCVTHHPLAQTIPALVADSRPANSIDKVYLARSVYRR
ncbi:hypothetical protein [Nitrosomonas mobilis]|uniref:hypothetical protein n=1 Tax=Nitrosomonas mobilis TaxID=51642 RepID=UPI000B7D6D90|nr:hypothetical protein [Nitrosomonas mobilis]